VRFPRYYSELMAWSVQQKLSLDGWKTVRVRKNNFNDANIAEIHTDFEVSLSAPIDAHLMVRKDHLLLVVTINNAPHICGVAVTGRSADGDAVKSLISGIKHIAKAENIYRGKKFEFYGVPKFINLEPRA
jgi:hypothetical protein